MLLIRMIKSKMDDSDGCSALWVCLMLQYYECASRYNTVTVPNATDLHVYTSA